MNTKQICISDLSTYEWMRLAGQIDNGFFGSEKTFTVERKSGHYYLLCTNKCDDVSIIKVYCKVGSRVIDKIERIAEDTEGWQEIYPSSYERVDWFLSNLRRE